MLLGHAADWLWAATIITMQLFISNIFIVHITLSLWRTLTNRMTTSNMMELSFCREVVHSIVGVSNIVITIIIIALYLLLDSIMTCGPC